MARRRSRSFQSWALGLVGVIVTAVVMYYVRVAAIDYIAERQIERTQRALEKLQALNTRPSTASAPQTYRQQDQYDAEVVRVAAETQRQHDIAWERFYQPPRGCDNWRSDQHMVECVEHKNHAKHEFEVKWAAGQLR
ncbi:hypothetical protein [Pseudomonas sp. PDM19]|uniref:hypothetical protein n=1 Tax=Pseudomonas sp. PDM19 TaxID=2769272 RepID=UPI00177BB536|nr:hypothetical protein [Pseudomonas sp. PDM19]MBD9634619.1 hypothetical protein [Pseudomonas sp. PDM19]